ncbi:MAG: glycosyltransferase family 2 protein [Acidobacteria bacterium]|nr:glycosyltransferase family 2 protein [Acidobacteriota bacterium]MBI3279636.1 glycosyltransferase family 2 protein [Acidobacteriota bacterium]
MIVPTRNAGAENCGGAAFGGASQLKYPESHTGRDQTMSPKVSVIISAYNEERHLGLAITSILSQTFSDFELIVVDDGSSDGTLTVVRSFGDARIRILELQHGGLASALNAGILAARGGYIARLDADDVALLDRLEEQVRFLDGHAEYGIVGAQCTVLREGEDTPILAIVPLDDPQIRRRVRRENPFFHSCIMARRNLLIAAGLYRPDLRWEDYDLWWRILEHSKGANLPAVLCRRTLRARSLSAIQKSENYRARLAVQRSAAAREGWSLPGLCGMLESCAAWLAFACMRRASAMRFGNSRRSRCVATTSGL